VDVCENYWDSCISDNPLEKYNASIVFGNSSCRAVTDSACGPNRVVASSIPGSQPDDTTLGAFDLGPYSTVSQPTAAPSVATYQTLTWLTTQPTFSEISNGGEGSGTTSQMRSASTSSTAASGSRSSTATISASSPTASPSKNAAPESSKFEITGTLGGLFTLVILWL
jgi:hypothetical protein